MNYLTKLTKLTSFRKGFLKKCWLPLVLLLLLLGCGGGSSGGGDGSGSSGDDDSIAALQGLWIQNNACDCKVFDMADLLPTRCFFYFEGSRAVSGYIQSVPSRCSLIDNDSYARQLSESDRNTIIQQARGITLGSTGTGTHIAAAAGTVFSVGSITATLEVENRIENRSAIAIDYIYAPGLPRRFVCSVYWRDGDDLYLGLGIPEDKRQLLNREVCAANRYTTLDPYFNPF